MSSFQKPNLRVIALEEDIDLVEKTYLERLILKKNW